MKATICFVGAGAAAILLSTGGYAVADNPHPQVMNLPTTLSASYCGFPIQTEILDNKEYYVQDTGQLPDGSEELLVTGQLFVSVENLDTGRTIDVNASGPGRYVFHPDGSLSFESTGHLLHWATPVEQAEFGLPGLFVADGLATGYFDPTGAPTEIHLDGHLTDLCAALR